MVTHAVEAPHGSAVRPARLENGDHLTRDEFERRYAEMPDVKKAELVEGVVYIQGRVTELRGAHTSVSVDGSVCTRVQFPA